MPKVVLVNPPLTTEERYGVHFQSGGRTPPLGLACLASVLLAHGIPTRIVDGTTTNDYEKTVEDILDWEPDIVGPTAATMSIHNAAKVAEMVKASNPRITTLIGGPHITAVPIETMTRFPCFDIGVVGEAERTIIELLAVLENKGNPATVNGIVYRGQYAGEIMQTPRRPFIDDLDTLPPPAWDLLPNLAEHYCPPVHTVRKLPAALLVASRGCPGKCRFCDRSVFGNVSRAHSASYVFNMMRELHDRHGIREIQFRDDNFLAFRPRLVELCRLLKESKLDMTWTLAGRADMVNEEILDMLKVAGCWQIWYGVESGSQRVLDFINKRTKLDKIRSVVKMTRAAGIDVGGFFMLGMPTETPADVDATIRLSRELALNEAHFCFFTPLPGCELYPVAKQYGSFDDDWHKLNCWNPVFVPSGMTEKQLVGYWRRASAGFYLRPSIVLGYVRRIRSLKHIRVYLSGLLALLEALLVKKYGVRRTD